MGKCGDSSFFTLLPKKGTSSFEEQKTLITRFIRVFKKNNILGLVADREFGHEDLFRWLQRENIPFYIRIKNNAVIKTEKRRWSIKNAFAQLQPKQQMYLPDKMKIYGNTLFVAAGRSEKGDLMMVVTNQPPQNAVNIYLKRWGIETLFSCLKKRGFNFEDTHMTRHERIAKLMVFLAVGFCWAFKLGQWTIAKRQDRIVMKNFKEGKRPQKSFFRLGLDMIRETVIHPRKTTQQFGQVLGIFNRKAIILEGFL